MSGHSYGDWYLMDNFINSILYNQPSKILSGLEETLESHLLVFASGK